MTVGEIKTTIAAYLEREQPGFLAGSVNLLNISINNARRFAERAHDFAHLHSYGKLLMPAGESGVLLSAMTDTSDTPISCKTLLQTYLRTAGGDFPIRLHEKSVIAKLMMQQQAEYTASSTSLVAPADFELNPQILDYNRVYRSGNRLYYYPTPTAQLELRADVVLWAPDYTLDSDTDFFTEKASDYLVMRGVVEANHLTGTFAFRSEGDLPPPEKLADIYLQSIIEQDKATMNDGLTPEMF